jgi:hypothetical protein
MLYVDSKKTMICRKPHVASSICLRFIIFQNTEGNLWTHCILYVHSKSLEKDLFVFLKTSSFAKCWEILEYLSG